MAKQHDKQFKLDAIQYYQDHKDLGVRGCAENLGALQAAPSAAFKGRRAVLSAGSGWCSGCYCPGSSGCRPNW